MGRTSIEWTDMSWNPGIYGCEEISPACANCYAAKMAHRLVASGVYPAGITTRRASGVHWSGHVVVSPLEELSNRAVAELPRKKPTLVFVTSMADVGHDVVSRDFILRLWAIFASYPHLTFQVLTKRPARLGESLRSITLEELKRDTRRFLMYTPRNPRALVHPSWWGSLVWPLPNVWVGVTVEDQPRADTRIPELTSIPAAVRFLSMEPLLGPVDLRIERCPKCGGSGRVLDGDDCFNCDTVGTVTFSTCGTELERSLPASIDWVIAGGESGSALHTRPTDPDWFRSIRDQCVAAGVPFLFKQWGEWAPDPSGMHPKRVGHLFPSGEVARIGKKAAGRLLDGREWNEFPGDANE